jgi:hypothetical protein
MHSSAPASIDVVLWTHRRRGAVTCSAHDDRMEVFVSPTDKFDEDETLEQPGNTETAADVANDETRELDEEIDDETSDDDTPRE